MNKDVKNRWSLWMVLLAQVMEIVMQIVNSNDVDDLKEESLRKLQWAKGVRNFNSTGRLCKGAEHKKTECVSSVLM